MIAAPPQKSPSIRERYLAFVEHMKSVPDRMLESIASQCHCPHCGDPLPLRWARWSERWQVYHPLTWCELRGETWYGATREEAIAEFQEFKSRVPTAKQSLPSDGTKGDAPLSGEADYSCPSPTGAATFQGMAFSAEGLDEEAVNSLLTMKED